MGHFGLWGDAGTEVRLGWLRARRQMRRRQGLWGGSALHRAQVQDGAQGNGPVWLEDGGGQSGAGLWGDRPPFQLQPNAGMSFMQQKEGSIQSSPCREWSLQVSTVYGLAYHPWHRRPGLRDRERGALGALHQLTGVASCSPINRALAQPGSPLT